MGNCVACVNKNEKKRNDFDGITENNNKPERVSNLNDMKVDKSMFVLTNDGKFNDKYSMGNLLGQGAFGEVRKC